MAIKKRAVRYKLLEWLRLRRMRKIVKKYEEENKERLPHISLMEELESCFDEYLKQVKVISPTEMLVSEACKRFGVTPEEVEVIRTDKGGYDVVVSPKAKLEYIEITVKID